MAITRRSQRLIWCTLLTLTDNKWMKNAEAAEPSHGNRMNNYNLFSTQDGWTSNGFSDGKSYFFLPSPRQKFTNISPSSFGLTLCWCHHKRLWCNREQKWKSKLYTWRISSHFPSFLQFRLERKTSLHFPLKTPMFYCSLSNILVIFIETIHLF